MRRSAHAVGPTCGRVRHARAEGWAGGRWPAQVVRLHQGPCPHDTSVRDELEPRPAVVHAGE
eukprot:1663301-Lingulodinium_polyedra.AAC.1